MKNRYSSPIVELLLYEKEDIITTSTFVQSDAQQDFFNKSEDPWVSSEGK